MSSNARQSSSSKIIFAGISFLEIRQKTQVVIVPLLSNKDSRLGGSLPGNDYAWNLIKVRFDLNLVPTLTQQAKHSSFILKPISINK